MEGAGSQASSDAPKDIPEERRERHANWTPGCSRREAVMPLDRHDDLRSAAA
jgi:hypothetical protein